MPLLEKDIFLTCLLCEFIDISAPDEVSFGAARSRKTRLSG
jgi:hypothetical protein